MAQPDAVDGCSLKWQKHNVDGGGALLRGYLAGTSGRRHGGQACGSERSPWRVTAQPGQRLRFTLMDFSSTVDQLDDGDVDHVSADAVQSSLKTSPRRDNDGPYTSRALLAVSLYNDEQISFDL